MPQKKEYRKKTDSRIAAIREKLANFEEIEKKKQSILSKKITERREEYNFTISELAELVGVDRGVISDWEKPDKKRKPNLSNLWRLSEVLDCDIGFLFGEHDTAEYSNEYIRRETGLSESAIRTLRDLNGADTGHIFKIQDYVNAVCDINAKEGKPLLGVWGHLNCLIEIPEVKPGTTTREQYSFYDAKRLYHSGSIQQAFLELADAIRKSRKNEQRLTKAHEQINSNVEALNITEDEANRQRRQLQFTIDRSNAEKTLQMGINALTQAFIDRKITWEEAEAQRDSANAAHSDWLENEIRFLEEGVNDA